MSRSTVLGTSTSKSNDTASRVGGCPFVLKTKYRHESHYVVYQTIQESKVQRVYEKPNSQTVGHAAAWWLVYDVANQAVRLGSETVKIWLTKLPNRVDLHNPNQRGTKRKKHCGWPLRLVCLDQVSHKYCNDRLQKRVRMRTEYPFAILPLRYMWVSWMPMAQCMFSSWHWHRDAVAA